MPTPTPQLAPERKSFEFDNLPVGVIQAAYHKITNKVETLIKGHDSNKRVTKDNIRQLFEKIDQFSNQYDCQAKNAVIHVRHELGSTLVLSSLEKFLQYDETINTQTIEISLEIQFLIKLPAIDDYQNYKIEIEIDSVNFLERKRHDNLLLELFDYPSFVVKIEYVDYVVAKALQVLIDDWISSLDDLTTSPFLQFIRRKIDPYARSSIYFNLTRAAAILSSTYAFLSVSTKYAKIETIPALVSGLCVYAATTAVTYSIMMILAGAFFDQVRRYRSPNIILLNKGDNRNLARYEEKLAGRIRKVLAILGSAIAAILLNVFAAYIYDLVK